MGLARNAGARILPKLRWAPPPATSGTPARDHPRSAPIPANCVPAPRRPPPDPRPPREIFSHQSSTLSTAPLHEPDVHSRFPLLCFPSFTSRPSVPSTPSPAVLVTPGVKPAPALASSPALPKLPAVSAPVTFARRNETLSPLLVGTRHLDRSAFPQLQSMQLSADAVLCPVALPGTGP